MKPLVIGVAGGSGSGKTTFVGRLVEAIRPAQATVLSHDRYYRSRPDLPASERANLNFDHPDALETTLVAEHIRALIRGDEVDVPVYDFTEHLRRPDAERIRARDALVVEGILVLSDAVLRSLFDIKVFIDVDDDTRLMRRVERDVRERGRHRSSVVAQYTTTVRPMYERFVAPAREHADLLVTGGGHNDAALATLVGLVRARRPDWRLT